MDSTVPTLVSSNGSAACRASLLRSSTIQVWNFITWPSSGRLRTSSAVSPNFVPLLKQRSYAVSAADQSACGTTGSRSSSGVTSSVSSRLQHSITNWRSWMVAIWSASTRAEGRSRATVSVCVRGDAAPVPAMAPMLAPGAHPAGLKTAQ